MFIVLDDQYLLFHTLTALSLYNQFPEDVERVPLLEILYHPECFHQRPDPVDPGNLRAHTGYRELDKP